MLGLRVFGGCKCCPCCTDNPGGSTQDALLQESLSALLQENGDLILLAEALALNALLTESGDPYVTESGDPIVTD